jgi:Fic family protein
LAFRVIYATPSLTPPDREVLELIDRQRDRLRSFTQYNARRWFGSLRRTTFARAIQGSNSIEGYHTTMDEAVAVVDDEDAPDQRTETWNAIKGYRDAMTYIMQASQDNYFEFGKQFLKSLHFMMLSFDMTKLPGQWRPGAVFVVSTRTGETVYEAPDVELVDGLVQELIDALTADTQTPLIVRAAMAHLNLAMIHPFKDGNGRMARALQTLVIARDGLLHPVFSSIEEWLGRNTGEYYDILATVGQGAWHPERDAAPWLRFCLKAHYQQAATLIRRNEEYEQLFNGIQAILQRERLPDRMAISLFDAALGLRLTNRRYRTETDLTEFGASRDLKRLSEAGLLDPKGERRGRVYFAAKPLIDLRAAVRIRVPLADPYDLVATRRSAAQEPRLPGL